MDCFQQCEFLQVCEQFNVLSPVCDNKNLALNYFDILLTAFFFLDWMMVPFYTHSFYIYCMLFRSYIMRCVKTDLIKCSVLGNICVLFFLTLWIL